MVVDASMIPVCLVTLFMAWAFGLFCTIGLPNNGTWSNGDWFLWPYTVFRAVATSLGRKVLKASGYYNRGMKCPDCGHSIRKHVARYGNMACRQKIDSLKTDKEGWIIPETASCFCHRTPAMIRANQHLLKNMPKKKSVLEELDLRPMRAPLPSQKSVHEVTADDIQFQPILTNMNRPSHFHVITGIHE